MSARTSAKGANARSSGARASARTSAKGANARSAGGRASASTSAKDRRMEEICPPVPQFHTQVVRLSDGDLKFYDRELHRDVVQ